MRKRTAISERRRRFAGLRRWRRHVARRNKVFVSSPEVRVAPPAILSFSRNFDATVAFLDRIRDETLGDGEALRKRVYVDLVPVQELSVPVAIVLAAEFHRWSLIKRTRLETRRPSRWAAQVRHLLTDLGVFDLLKTKPVKGYNNGLTDNFTLSPLESGESFDGEKINELQSHFKEILYGFTNRSEVFEGLMEAAENAISHAYPDGYRPAHPYAGHRWWGASCLNVAEHRLRFFIFDQGAGIPYTLPKGPLWEHILPYLAQLSFGLLSDDAPMLKAAFEVGRTSTGMTNRGLGLRRMADVVRGSKSGYLRIISGKAELVHHHDDRIVTNGL